MGNDVAKPFAPIAATNHAADLCEIVGLDPMRVREAKLIIRPDSLVILEAQLYIDNEQMEKVKEKVRNVVLSGNPTPGMHDMVRITTGVHEGSIGRIVGREPYERGLWSVRIGPQDGAPEGLVNVYADEMVRHLD
jgi:hypothetical protein